MKKKVLISLILGIMFILATVLTIWALVPPPPANQTLGIYDTVFGSFTEPVCRSCHQPQSTNVNRHHMLVQNEGFECLDCHESVWDPVTMTWVLAPFRDCLLCHTSSPHHATADAVARHCKACHGSFVDNYDDGHYIPTYAKSMVTPDTSCRDWTGTTCNAGGCEACHVASSAVSPAIYSNADTHHGTGLGVISGTSCTWCHMDTSALDIRRCEDCHGVASLHNIQADSDNAANPGTIAPGQENLGYGHIGNNWDCWGCHGWFDKYDVAPYSGATVPSISSLSATSVEAGVNTVLTINGASLTNNVVDPYGNIVDTVTANVALDNGSVAVTLQPTSVEEDQLIVTIPSTLAAGTYDLQAVKGDKMSNKKTLLVVTPVKITTAKLTRRSSVVTITGSGFGVNPTSPDYKTGLGVFIKSSECTINSWSDTKIVCSSKYAKPGEYVTVKSLMGSASKKIVP